MTSFARLVRNLVAGLGLLAALPAFAQNDDDQLLPVTQAFHLTTDASQPGTVKLHWRIAPQYYLYRGRIKIKAADPAAVTLGEAKLPDGALGWFDTFAGERYDVTDNRAANKILRESLGVFLGLGDGSKLALWSYGGPSPAVVLLGSFLI